MEQEIAPLQAAIPEELQPKIPNRSAFWLNLALFLIGGAGLFVLSSYLLSVFLKTTPETIKALQENMIWLMAASVLLNALFLGGSYFYLGVWRKKVTLAEAGIRPVRWRWEWLVIAVFITVFLLPLRVALGYLVQLLLPEDMRSLTLRLSLITGGQTFSWLNFAASFVLVGIIGPISEELYFRGLLHGWLEKGIGLIPRVLISSSLFGLAHFDSIPVAVSAFVLGGVNALAYERTRSIFLPIAIHMVNNMIGVVLLYATMLFVR